MSYIKLRAERINTIDPEADLKTLIAEFYTAIGERLSLGCKTNRDSEAVRVLNALDLRTSLLDDQTDYLTLNGSIFLSHFNAALHDFMILDQNMDCIVAENGESADEVCKLRLELALLKFTIGLRCYDLIVKVTTAAQ